MTGYKRIVRHCHQQMGHVSVQHSQFSQWLNKCFLLAGQYHRSTGQNEGKNHHIRPNGDLTVDKLTAIEWQAQKLADSYSYDGYYNGYYYGNYDAYYDGYYYYHEYRDQTNGHECINCAYLDLYYSYYYEHPFSWGTYGPEHYLYYKYSEDDFDYPDDYFHDDQYYAEEEDLGQSKLDCGKC